MERSDNIAIPLCESVRDGVEGNGTPAVTVSRLRSPSEEVSGTKWTTLPERMRRASKDSRRSLTSSAGLARTQWSVSVMESVPVLPIGSGEPRFSGRKACEARMDEPLPDRHCGSGRSRQAQSSSAIPLTYSERMRTIRRLIGESRYLADGVIS